MGRCYHFGSIKQGSLKAWDPTGFTVKPYGVVVGIQENTKWPNLAEVLEAGKFSHAELFDCRE